VNTKERHLARILFQICVYRSDGQAYEDLFTKIMGYAYRDFVPMKPQGAIGDCKNDGYIPSTGHYYQVYAPEKPNDSVSNAVNKVRDDFDGLREYWHDKRPILAFSFVFNDKYKGTFPTIEAVLLELKPKYSLRECGCFLAKHLEDTLFALADDQIFTVTGCIPDPADIKDIDYSILREVIKAILAASKAIDATTVYEAPDFEKKIEFNGLSRGPASMLRVASYQSGHLEHYFARNSTFAKQELRDAMNRLYSDARTQDFLDDVEHETRGDMIFCQILKEITPSNSRSAQDAALVVMAYFFESCDIFEDPLS